MTGAVIIRACATVNEALIVAELLRDGGFEASIDNYYHASLDWWSISAFGGVYVRVPEGQLIDAGQYMIEAVQTADERVEASTGQIFEPIEKTRHVTAWSMLFLYTGVAYFILTLVGMAIAWFLETIIPER